MTMTTKKTTKKKLPSRAEAKTPVWARAMNPEQLEAIEHTDGPLRLLAAAGSGKTRVVVHRILRLVTAGAVRPNRVLAVTFSTKAAGEMTERLKKLGCKGSRVGTWHSLCLEILKADCTPMGSWTVEGDKNVKGSNPKMVLKDVLGYRGMDWKGVDFNLVVSFIGRCKANLFDDDSSEARALAETFFGGYEAKHAVEAFARYNIALAEKRILTFDDMLVFAARHLASDENVRLAWANRYDHVIQDEAQDANRAQNTIAWLLARDHRNYMVVGDVFQAIYAFRGSSPDYLANFENEWPGAKTIWLGTNYRSGRAIINAANGIVRPARVPGYEPRDMVAGRDVDGLVSVRASEDLDGEAASFVAWVQNLLTAGDAARGDIVALYRTNAQSRALEEKLLGARIPYVVVGGTSFYERTEVRSLLGYLRVASERGTVEDIKRCINAPFRFLGAAFVDRVMHAADGRKGIDWTSLVMDVAQQAGLQSRQRGSAAEWCEMIEGIAERVKASLNSEATDYAKALGQPSVILEDIVRNTRYIEWLSKEEGSDSIENSAASNVRELIRVAGRFNTVVELLSYIDETLRSARKQREDGQAGGDRVLLMTVHKAKGLEWPHVWIAGLNEMVLPHMRGDAEEERRVAYVAATRARDSLVLSHVRTLATRAGVKDAEPSRFIFDTGIAIDAEFASDTDRVEDISLV